MKRNCFKYNFLLLALMAQSAFAITLSKGSSWIYQQKQRSSIETDTLKQVILDTFHIDGDRVVIHYSDSSKSYSYFEAFDTVSTAPASTDLIQGRRFKFIPSFTFNDTIQTTDTILVDYRTYVKLICSRRICSMCPYEVLTIIDSIGLYAYQANPTYGTGPIELYLLKMNERDYSTLSGEYPSTFLKQDGHQLMIGPNPSNHMFNIRAPNLQVINSDFSLFGIDGKLLLKGKLNSSLCLPASFSKGTYLIEIKVSNQTFLGKIIKL